MNGALILVTVWIMSKVTKVIVLTFSATETEYFLLDFVSSLTKLPTSFIQDKLVLYTLSPHVNV